MLIVFLHMLRTFYTASYKKPRQFTWFTGVLLLIFTGFLSFTGYLLPWDQLALWAVTIGASMAEATPLIGEQVNLLVRGGPEMGANGLLRFYMAHVLLLPVFALHLRRRALLQGRHPRPQPATTRRDPGEDSAKRVPLDRRVYFIPDMLTSELMWFGVTTFILIVLCIWFYHAPLESHADPQVTPLGTTAPWYFLWNPGRAQAGRQDLLGRHLPHHPAGLPHGRALYRPEPGAPFRAASLRFQHLLPDAGHTGGHQLHGPLGIRRGHRARPGDSQRTKLRTGPQPHGIAASSELSSS